MKDRSEWNEIGEDSGKGKELQRTRITKRVAKKYDCEESGSEIESEKCI